MRRQAARRAPPQASLRALSACLLLSACGPALLGEEGAPLPLAGGELLDPLPFALLGARCTGGQTAPRLVLAASGSSCGQASAILGGAAPEGSFASVSLQPSGPQTIETSGQLCDASCRTLPLTIEVSEHPEGGAARGRYRFTEGGRVVATGAFSTEACAYERMGARDKVVVDRLSFSQAVDIPLYDAGALISARNAPIIRGRAAQLRAFVHSAAARPLSARLLLRASELADARVDDSLQVETSSGSYSALDSSFNFDLPGALIQADSALSLELTEADGCPAWVEEEDALQEISLDAREDFAFRAVFVPVTYLGHPVELSEALVEECREHMLRHYPVSEASLTVTLSDTPIVWDEEIPPLDQDGWVPLLSAVEDRRRADEAARDTFYFAVFEPPEAFCEHGCIHGVAPINRRATGPAQIGIGRYDAPRLKRTFIHEMGHALGRAHAPCHDPGRTAPTAVDADYPYSGGLIGVWGTELYSEEISLHAPDSSADFMGYCTEKWVSDYTYSAIYERLAYNHAQLGNALGDRPTPRRWLRLSQAGARLRWLGETTQLEAPGGDPVAAFYLDAAGAVIAEATAYRTELAELEDAGLFKLPPAPEGASEIRLAGYGQLARLALTAPGRSGCRQRYER